MTVEKIGLWHDPQHRYYYHYADKSGGPLPSVTGVIGILDKPAVAYWRGTTVATIIAKDLDFYGKLIETGGVDAAVAWAGKLPGYEAEKAANTGSLVHILAEKILRQREFELDVELLPYVQAFRNFLDARKPKVVSVERQVANLSLGYAGTLDLLLDYGDGIELWDLKTWRKLPIVGRDTYAETALQLAGYKHAEFIGSPGDPKRHRMPKITRCGVLHLRPDLYSKGWQTYPYDVTDAEWHAFQACLVAHTWKQTRSKLVIGEPPIVVPKEQAA